MSTLEEQIEIGAPADAAWDQLHRIADYPRFVEGVLHASARGSHRARLDVAVDGGHREFDAFFTDRGHNRVMTWETVDEPHLRGTFALRPLDEHRTQVQVRIEYERRRWRSCSAVRRTVSRWRARSSGPSGRTWSSCATWWNTARGDRPGRARAQGSSCSAQMTLPVSV
ncbi:SRPBCC family protein [Kitasatospora arboriphila]